MKKNRGGRPRAVIDWDLVEECCQIHCTGEEIASLLGINYETLERAVKREFKMSFVDYYAIKSAGGKKSLRRRQYTAAMEGENAMLIWLGKQWLGQKDTQHMDHSGSLTVNRITKRFDGSIPSDDDSNE